MHKTFGTVNEHIRFRKNGTASFEREAFKKPESNTPGRWKDFEVFTMFLPQGMQWSTEGLYPTSISHGKLKHYPNGIKVFIPDKTAPKPTSPCKGKPVYDVSHLSGGSIMRTARVSGNIKLEIPLLKNDKLADLGTVINDVMTAYYNIQWEQEAKAMFGNDNAA